jgi:hypothetical protein
MGVDADHLTGTVHERAAGGAPAERRAVFDAPGDLAAAGSGEPEIGHRHDAQ